LETMTFSISLATLATLFKITGQIHPSHLRQQTNLASCTPECVKHDVKFERYRAGLDPVWFVRYYSDVIDVQLLSYWSSILWSYRTATLYSVREFHFTHQPTHTCI
jgi:hypothetical protein